MNKFLDIHFKREVMTIYPGEYYSSFGPEYISTVLGSCVAIALYDAQHKIGGLNHFILAKGGSNGRNDSGLVGRFGEFAVELLINDMLQKGAVRANLTAKVFGGSNVFNISNPKMPQVGNDNINFAFSYLERENIPVIASDTGGVEPRKIIYDPSSSKIWLKRIKSDRENQEIQAQENIYISSVKKKQENESTGDIIWFK